MAHLLAVIVCDLVQVFIFLFFDRYNIDFNCWDISRSILTTFLMTGVFTLVRAGVLNYFVRKLGKCLTQWLLWLATKMSRKAVEGLSFIWVFRLSCLIIFDRLSILKVSSINFPSFWWGLIVCFGYNVNSLFNSLILDI